MIAILGEAQSLEREKCPHFGQIIKSSSSGGKIVRHLGHTRDVFSLKAQSGTNSPKTCDRDSNLLLHQLVIRIL